MKRYLLFAIFIFSFCEVVEAQTCFSGLQTSIVNTGGVTKGVVAADFNGDGYPDIVTANGTLNVIQVMMNNGTGGFPSIVSYATGASPDKIVVSDFNVDGKKDLAVTNYSGNSISIFINNGSGGFNPGVLYSIFNSPLGITATDLNLDGRADLVCVGGTNLQVLLNNGTGVFLPQTSFSSYGGLATAVVSGRINNDGFNDIVYSCSNGWSFIKYGTGVGTFTAPTYSFISSGSISGMVTGDFNADGLTDIAASAGSDVTVFSNNGSGNFNTLPTVPLSGGGPGISSGDFNGDGITDFVCSRTCPSIVLNNGNSTFTKLTDFSVAGGGSTAGTSLGVATADFNLDGKIDFVTTTNGSGQVWVFYNSAPGVFGVIKSFASTVASNGLDFVDFDNDGIKDIITADGTSSTGSLILARGLPNNTYAAPVTFANPSGPTALTVGDFNGDARPDVATINPFSSTMSLYMNNGLGGFLSAVNYSVGGASAINSGDFNHDGHPDIAVAVSNVVKIFMNNGTGIFSSSVSYSTFGSGYSLVVIDFDFDGNLDLVEGGLNKFHVLLGNPSGVFTVFGGPLMTTDSPRYITVGDYNQDGFMDIVTENWNTFNYAIYFGTGSMNFQPPVYFSSVNSGFDLKTCDYNRDGFPDFAASDYTYTSVTIFENNHLGGFIPHVYGAPEGVITLLWTDSNGDGLMDLMYTNFAGSCVSLLLNSTSIISSVGPSITCGNNPVILIANLNANSYLWSPGASTNDSLTVTSSGTYSCITTNLNGMCTSASATFNVTINSSAGPVATLSPSNDSMCINQPPIFLGGAPVGGVYSGIGTSGTNFDASIAGVGMHPVQYVFTNALGCSDTANTNITVLPLPLVSFSQPGNDTVCISSTPITLSGLPIGGVYSGSGVSGNIFDPSVAGIGTHILTYSFTSSFGCNAVQTLTITVVGPIPITISTSGPTVFCQPLNVILTASSGFSNYSWSSGPTTTSISVNQTGNYAVTGTTIYGCSSTSAALPVVANSIPVVNLTTSGPTTFCAPDSVTLYAGNTFVSYLWNSGQVIDSIVVHSSGSYNVTVVDANGCTGNSSSSITVSANIAAQVVINAVGANSLCAGDSLELQATSGMQSYVWNTGATSDSINVSVSGNYYVDVTDANGCQSSDSSLITFVNCSLVWPGNTNKDSIVDNFDLLPVGVHYGQMGYPRQSVSNVWQGFPCYNWGFNQVSGYDMKFVDSDGNGVVDFSDTTAVGLNYGQIDLSPPVAHPSSTMNPQSVGAPLFFWTSSSTYFAGDLIDVYVWAGDTLQPVNHLYGGAFTVNFTQGLTDPNTTSFTYPNNWLCNPLGDGLILQKTYESAGYVDGAIVRYDHLGRTGYGPIGVLHFQANSGITVPTIMNFNFQNYVLIDSAGNELVVTPTTYSITINPIITTTTEQNDISVISVYPNPANNQIEVGFYSAQPGEYSIVICDLLGQEVIHENHKTSLKGDQHLQLDVTGLAEGNYILSIQTPTGKNSKRIIVTH